MNKKTAVIYARVSTVRQADEGISIDSQIEQGRHCAAELQADVVKVFRDDGISGRTANRPAFQSAIRFCADNGIDFFIIWNTSRFARNKLDAASHKKLLEEVGTKVVYVSVNIDNETDEGWFSESIFEIIDEHYSRQISRDTQRSMLKNARDGFWNGGRPPYGYQAIPVGQRKRLVIRDEEAVVVQEMFRMFFAGLGCKSIAMNLNDRGLHYRNGQTWSKAHVAAVLKNPSYAGLTIFNRRDRNKGERPESEWIMTKSHTALISEEDADRARSIFKQRAPEREKGSPHSSFVFTGLLRCGECGSAMQTESATGRSKVYHYYNCSQNQKKGGCRPRRIAAAEFDRWMMDIIIDNILTTERMREVVVELKQLSSRWEEDRSRRVTALNKRMREALRSRRNLFEVLELHGKNTPHLGDLTIRLREINETIKRLEASMFAVEQEEEPDFEVTDKQILEATRTLRKIMRTTSDARRLRLLMGNFVEQILVNEGDVEITYHPERIMKTKNRLMKAVLCEGIWLPEQGSNLRPAD